ncbi:helix-turn-helix domain-containing protein [Formosa sp. PL04]|uniref:TetR/AcrR family transcriptional regulator n=1 Tax=Formosa sp. PL04 TaxID=3081755 RepID=UPI00298234F7|nr:helix-turn-helix domain-containing protein [Formosa sp. PL04]
MSRKKQYNEEEVIEKAMDLFWRNGYEKTSVRMLEKEMGINQFSMYSSFVNKQGVFVGSITCYRSKIKVLTDALKNSNNGKEGIKKFFYDFVEFSKENTLSKGCLITNTVNELGENADPIIRTEIEKFASDIRALFYNNLKQDASKDEETLEKQSNFLIICKQGLSNATKVFTKPQLVDFIEITFKMI